MSRIAASIAKLACLVAALMVCGPVSGHGGGAPEPFEPPVISLPEPGGISVLYGEWVSTDRDDRKIYGSLPIEPGRIVYEKNVTPAEYRVLHEGEKFIYLFVRQPRLTPPVGEMIYFFNTLSVIEVDPHYHLLRETVCGPFRRMPNEPVQPLATGEEETWMLDYRQAETYFQMPADKLMRIWRMNRRCGARADDLLSAEPFPIYFGGQTKYFPGNVNHWIYGGE